MIKVPFTKSIPTNFINIIIFYFDFQYTKETKIISSKEMSHLLLLYKGIKTPNVPCYEIDHWEDSRF